MKFEGNTTCYDFNNSIDSSNKLYIPLQASLINIENRTSFGMLTKANLSLISSELSNFTKIASFERKEEEIRKYGPFNKYIYFSTPDLYFLYTEKNFMYILSHGKDGKFKVNKLLASKEKILDIIEYDGNPLIVKNNGIIQQITCQGTPVFKKPISDKLTHGVTYTKIKIIKQLKLNLLLTDFNKLIFIFNEKETLTNKDKISDIIAEGFDINSSKKITEESKEKIKSVKGVLNFDVLFEGHSNKLLILLQTSDNLISIYSFDNGNTDDNYENDNDHSEIKYEDDNVYLRTKISEVKVGESIDSIRFIKSNSVYYKSPYVLVTFKSHAFLLDLHLNNIMSFNEKINFVQVLPTSVLYPNGNYIIEMKQTRIMHDEFIASSFSQKAIYNINTKLPDALIILKSTSKFNININSYNYNNNESSLEVLSKEDTHKKQLKCYSVNCEGFGLLKELNNKKNSFYWDYVEPPITYKTTEKEFYVANLIETGYDSVYIVVTSIGLFFYDGYEEKWRSVNIEENKLAINNTIIHDGLIHIKHLKNNEIAIVSKIEEKNFLLVFNVTLFINKQSNAKIGQASHSLKLIGNCILSNPPNCIYYDKYLVLNNEDKIIILDFIKQDNKNKGLVKIVKRETVDLNSLTYKEESKVKGIREVKIKKYANGQFILFALNNENKLFSITESIQNQFDNSSNSVINSDSKGSGVSNLEIKATKTIQQIGDDVSKFTVYNLYSDCNSSKSRIYEEYYLFVEKLDGSISIIFPQTLLQINPSITTAENSVFKELTAINNNIGSTTENVKLLKSTKNTYKPGRSLMNNSLNCSYIPSSYNPFKVIKIINEIKEFNSVSSAHYVVATIKEVPFMMNFVKEVLSTNYKSKQTIDDLEQESDLITLIKSYENYSFYLEKLFYVHFNNDDNEEGIKESDIKIKGIASFIKTNFGSIWYSVIVNLLRKHESKYTTDILEAFGTSLEKIIKKFEINKESENLSKLCPVVEQTLGLLRALDYTVGVLEGFNMVYEVDINKGNLIEQTVNYMFNLRIKICEEKTKINVTGIDEENSSQEEDYGDIKDIDEGVVVSSKEDELIEYLDDQKSVGVSKEEDFEKEHMDRDESDEVELIEL